VAVCYFSLSFRFRKLLEGLQHAPRLLVTDTLGSRGVAHRELMASVIHWQSKCHSRAEGTVMLFENYCGVGGCGAVAMDQFWVVGISGGSVECNNLIPDCEAFGYSVSPSSSAHSGRLRETRLACIAAPPIKDPFLDRNVDWLIPLGYSQALGAKNPSPHAA
jgi:hypothetical protein